MDNKDLEGAIETVRNTLIFDDEIEAFERIVERLEGYEIAYNVILEEKNREKSKSQE